MGWIMAQTGSQQAKTLQRVRVQPLKSITSSLRNSAKREIKIPVGRLKLVLLLPIISVSVKSPYQSFTVTDPLNGLSMWISLTAGQAAMA